MVDDTPNQRNRERILRSPSYRLAYQDIDFLTESRTRAIRMQLELMKPELAFEDNHVRSTIVVFGSTRIVESPAAEANLERARARLADTPDDVRRQRAADISGVSPRSQRGPGA